MAIVHAVLKLMRWVSEMVSIRGLSFFLKKNFSLDSRFKFFYRKNLNLELSFFSKNSNLEMKVTL